jgi:hypothetical protein
MRSEKISATGRTATGANARIAGLTVSDQKRGRYPRWHVSETDRDSIRHATTQIAMRVHSSPFLSMY